MGLPPSVPSDPVPLRADKPGTRTPGGVFFPSAFSRFLEISVKRGKLETCRERGEKNHLEAVPTDVEMPFLPAFVVQSSPCTLSKCRLLSGTLQCSVVWLLISQYTSVSLFLQCWGHHQPQGRPSHLPSLPSEAGSMVRCQEGVRDRLLPRVCIPGGVRGEVLGCLEETQPDAGPWLSGS